MLKSVRNFLLLLPALSGCASDVLEGPSIQVSEGVALSPLGVSVMAFYAEFKNHGSLPDTLVALVVPGAEEATLHTMTMEGGMHRMEEIFSLALPPGETVALQPGGLHGMIDWDVPPASGDTISITLRFARSDSILLRIPILSPLDMP